MSKEKKECIACSSKEHDWKDCPYLEEKCKKCGDVWHLTEHHETKNLVADECNYKYGNYGDDGKPCQHCRSKGSGNKQPHCRNDKRCAICLDRTPKCSPYQGILEGEDNIEAWKQDRYKNFCFYWWKMKVGEGEDNKGKGRKVRSTTNIPNIETSNPNNDTTTGTNKQAWIIGISVLAGITIGIVSTYFWLRNSIIKKNK